MMTTVNNILLVWLIWTTTSTTATFITTTLVPQHCSRNTIATSSIYPHIQNKETCLNAIISRESLHKKSIYSQRNYYRSSSRYYYYYSSQRSRSHNHNIFSRLNSESSGVETLQDEEEKEIDSNRKMDDPKQRKNELLLVEEDTTTAATVDNNNQSILLLNLVAVIWGTQHSVIKMVVEDCNPSSFSLARFGLAALIASPFTPPLPPLSLLNKENNKVVDNTTAEDTTLVWRWGLEMGLWMFLGYAFQAIGLEYTTAQRSGFLLYLNVKFVPFFARILLGREISIPTWISAFIAFAGTFLLSYDDSSAFMIGDLWSVGAAAASAMFILRLEAATIAVKNSSALNSASLWTVTGMALLWCLGEDFTTIQESTTTVISNVIETISLHPFSLVYLGGITTALANYIQTKAQRNITAERASIIYALDPVYGAFFANILLGEQLSAPLGYIGAGLITFAAATNAYIDLGVNRDNDDDDK